MKRRARIAPIFLLAFVAGAAHATPDRVRFLEGAGAAHLLPNELGEEAKPYLSPGAIDAAAVVGPPPAIDTPEDKADVAAFRALNARAARAERWAIAIADDKSVYDRFSKEFGVSLDRKTLPRIVRMLNRVSADAFAAAGDAKKQYARPRPFQRFALTRVCGEAQPPKPEAAPTKGTSYPSGHAVVSWALVLVLEEVAPERAQPLIARGLEYGDSRVVCGLHFPRDIDAGRNLASIVVDRLIALPEFRRDVACAKTEVRAVLAGEKSEDLPACQ
jgi:acid phosphatase (class A)